jgi:S-layer homology domain
MKRFKLFLSTLVLALTLVGTTFSTTPVVQASATTIGDYTSTPEIGAVEFAIKKGFMWKYADGQFHGEKQITQGQFVSSLVAIRGVKEGLPVPQLPDGHWAKATYERAQKAGILTDVQINPDKLLTKEETALLVFNAWKPYRGVKDKGFTNTGALVTWGWMQPAPHGQPKFREDLPVTRGDAAVILRRVWQDKYQLELGEKYALEFHKSLKVVNGYLTGKIPKGDELLHLRVQFFTKETNNIVSYSKGQSFKVKIDDFSAMGFSATNELDFSFAAVYLYSNLNNHERKKMTQQFSDSE